MAPMKSKTSNEAGFKRLVELEAEYRTQRSPDQLHAIASFPHLFDEFPYPVIINAGILKLADYFRQSNNIQRHAILQVFKQSQTHLKMVINVEETIKRLSPMLQSTDPLARAITLRVLGCMATIVSDRIDVYHKVIHSLDSSEAMEVSAAVYAADMICAQSQRFCAIISGKLAFMVRDTTKTPLPLQRRLIRIFGHMFEDITLARLARKTCLDILELNKDTEYTVAILRTLTRLASHSLVDVGKQIELLLQWAKDSSNSQPGVRRVSLTCLTSLAQNNTEFSHDQIKTIFDIASESKEEKTTLTAMLTLRAIFRLTSIMTSITLLESGAKTVKGYIMISLEILDRFFSALSSTSSASTSSTNTSATLTSAQSSKAKLVVLECYAVLTAILPYYRHLEAAGMMPHEAAETFRAATKTVTQSMQQFLVTVLSHGRGTAAAGESNMSEEDVAQVRMVLGSLVALTPEEGSGVDTLLEMILGWIDAYKGSSALLARALLQIAQQAPKRVHSLRDTLMTCLENRVDSSDTQTFIVVYRALLESCALYRTSSSISESKSFESRVSQLLEQFGRVDMLEQYTRNHWELYQLARYSLQTGWSSLALVALRNQEKAVKSVPASLWLTAVQTLALIESSLPSAAAGLQAVGAVGGATSQENEVGRLDLCSQKQMYTKVVSFLEELEVYQVDRSFHLQFCALRRHFLDTCQITNSTLQLLSASLSSDAHEPTPHGHPQDEIVLYRCAENFSRLAHQYTMLRASVASHSSTPQPLAGSQLTQARGIIVRKSHRQSDEAIEVLQTMCLVVAYAIQRVAKILGNYGSVGAGAEDSKDTQLDLADADVFDIDPLLIPLLYRQSQQSQGSAAGTGAEATESKTRSLVFQASMGMIIGFINENIVGAGTENVEKGIAIVRQLIAQFISFPLAVPQEFFASARSVETPSIAANSLE